MTDTLNFYGFDYNGKTLRGWSKAAETRDINYKIDITTNVDGQEYIGQIKARQPDSGSDIGIALFQPRDRGDSDLSRATLRLLFSQKRYDLLSRKYARDLRYKGDIYCVLGNTWEQMAVMPYREVLQPILLETMWEYLCGSEEELADYHRCFRSKLHDGVELRYTVDRGRRSFDSALPKIICYVPFAYVCGKPGVQMMTMIEVPDYFSKVLHD